jgi:hypothetical protein
MLRTLRFASLLLLLPFIAIIGCGDDNPADPPSTAVTWTRPNSGSTFTYSGYETDSNGVKIASSDFTYTDSVMASGFSARGVSNLVRMTFMDFFQIIVDYRANGDIAIAAEELDGIESPWTVFPVGSKGTITREAWSQTIVDSSVTVTWSTPYATISYLGAEQRTTPAGTFATHKVLMREYDTTSAGDPFVANDTTWYAPSIGSYVRKSRAADRAGSSNRLVIELSSHVLK